MEAAEELAGSQAGIRAGILRCDCYEYPVVEGIPVLRQLSPVSSTQNGAVERLHQGDVEGALLWLLAMGSAPGVPAPADPPNGFQNAVSFAQRLRGLVEMKRAKPGIKSILRLEDFEALLGAIRPGGYSDYLLHRFANPSFLGAIPPAVVIGDACRTRSRRRLLDLMCGAGHMSATLGALCPGVEIVMADVDYVNLYVAHRFLHPDGAALCVDIELPLPMMNGSIDAVSCLDGLHYVRSKVAFLNEVDRIVGPEGAWVFAHMHNAKSVNPNPGAPLDAQGYAQRFAFGQQRLLPESEILRQFQLDGSLDLSHQVDSHVLESSNAFTLVGARNDALWKQHPALDTAFCRRPDLLQINPLYRLERATDGLTANASWPSDDLKRECMGATPLLHESLQIHSGTLDEIASARSGGLLSDGVRELIRSFALVPLPTCYRRGLLADASSRVVGRHSHSEQ